MITVVNSCIKWDLQGDNQTKWLRENKVWSCQVYLI